MPSAQFYKLVHVWDDQAEYQNHLIKDDVKCYHFLEPLMFPVACPILCTRRMIFFPLFLIRHVSLQICEY